MNKVPIEELFRKRLKDYAETPPERVWLNVQRSLAARRRRRTLLMWTGIFFSGLGVLLLILFHQFSPQARNMGRSALRHAMQGISVNSWATLASVQETPPPSSFLAVSIPSKPTHNQAPIVWRNSVPKRPSAGAESPSSKGTPDVPLQNITSDLSLSHSQNFILDSPDGNFMSGPQEPSTPPSLQSSPITKEESIVPLSRVQNNSEKEGENSPEEGLQNKQATCSPLPVFVGLSYEAGSMWRILPTSYSPGAWMPATQMEDLSSSQGLATSFSDVFQSVQLYAGYRFGPSLGLQFGVGHSRISHFESGNLVSRSLPPEGVLGVMTATGAILLGPEAANSTQLVELRKLSQHFHFITLSPGITYQFNFRQWNVNVNAMAQAHVLVSDQAEGVFPHGVFRYRHAGLRKMNFSFSGGAAVGYRIKKWLLQVGFQGGYWLSPLTRPSFSGSRYLHLGVRPAITYNF
ncbi:MAG: hypothetical protein NZM65_03810 [Flavobacteriales bacterium]|nr:hypothetical protein [Flavobacteriales bacterium]MDW8409795.1 hypothetical protein [Flavobacteriales bacterium]